MILVLLQNAWSPKYAGRTWPRMLWLGALELSRSGKVLTQMTGVAPTVELVDDSDVWYDNTTPVVGATASSVVPTDPEHVRALLDLRPSLVLACGAQAEAAVSGWEGPLIVTRHPAYRLFNARAVAAVREAVDAHRDHGTRPRCRIYPGVPGAIHYSIGRLE